MRRRAAAAALADPITTQDIVVLQTEPIVLASGHQLRKQRCLVCATMIGGQVHRNITILDFRLTGCSCGQVPSLTFMVCDGHPIPSDPDLHRLALARYRCHHPGQQV